MHPVVVSDRTTLRNSPESESTSFVRYPWYSSGILDLQHLSYQRGQTFISKPHLQQQQQMETIDLTGSDGEFVVYTTTTTSFKKRKASEAKPTRDDYVQFIFANFAMGMTGLMKPEEFAKVPLFAKLAKNAVSAPHYNEGSKEIDELMGVQMYFLDETSEETPSYTLCTVEEQLDGNEAEPEEIKNPTIVKTVIISTDPTFMENRAK